MKLEVPNLGFVDMNPPLDTRIDYDGGTNPIYIGSAAGGSATSDPHWKVKRLTYDGSGNLLSSAHAGGGGFKFAWDDRANLTYVP